MGKIPDRRLANRRSLHWLRLGRLVGEGCWLTFWGAYRGGRTWLASRAVTLAVLRIDICSCAQSRDTTAAEVRSTKLEKALQQHSLECVKLGVVRFGGFTFTRSYVQILSSSFHTAFTTRFPKLTTDFTGNPNYFINYRKKGNNGCECSAR